MSSSYEFILTDDAGRKITPLKRWSFVTYSRTTQGFGAIQIGFPYDYYKSIVPEVFKLDWRIDVWRSPEEGFPMRRESSFFLMKFNIYEQVEGLKTIELFGRSPLEILRRGVIGNNSAPADYSNTDSADDIMKDMVRTSLIPPSSGTFTPVPYEPPDSVVLPSTPLYPEFSVDADFGSGESITFNTRWGTNLLDALKSIKNTTFALYNSTPSVGRKIYFDVIEGPGLSNGFGYIFKTYADMRGQDRRNSGLIFSVANGNLRKPSYYENFLDAITIVQIQTSGLDPTLGTAERSFDFKKNSRWSIIVEGRIFDFDDAAAVQAYGQSVINDKGTERVFSGDFLNTPGGPTQPRSLYGVDWDMGDLVRAEFADKAFDAEIKVVHVSVNENGRENIVGQTEVGQ